MKRSFSRPSRVLSATVRVAALASLVAGCASLAGDDEASSSAVVAPTTATVASAPAAKARTAILLGAAPASIIDRWVPAADERPLPRFGPDALDYALVAVDGTVIDRGRAPDPRVLDVEGEPGALNEAHTASGLLQIETPNAAGTLVVTEGGQELARLPVNPLPSVTTSPTAAQPTDFLGPPEKIAGTSNSPLALNLLILPEGYTEAELPKFREAAAILVGKLKEMDVYKEHWNAFNVFRQDVRSRESGVGEPNAPKDTAFELTFGDGTSRPRRCVIWDNGRPGVQQAMLRAKRSVRADVVAIVANATESGGCARFEEQTFAMTHAGAVEWRAGTFGHETAHALFKLNDEYAYDTCNVERWRSGAVNVSSDLTNLPWKALLTTSELPTPVSTTDSQANVVGAFEGAGYCSTGAYRGQRNCKMRESDRPFCAVCRHHIQEFFKGLSFVAGEDGGHFDAPAPVTEYVTEGYLAATSSGPVTVAANYKDTPFLVAGTFRVTMEGLEGFPFVQATSPRDSSVTCFTSGGDCYLTLPVPGKLSLRIDKYGSDAARYRVRVAALPPDNADGGAGDGGHDGGAGGDGGPDGGNPWPGFERSGALPAGGFMRFYTQQVLQAGQYRFAITGGSSDPDLYVRAGGEPSTTVWDCKSNGPGVVEACTLTLNQPQRVHVLVHNAGRRFGNYTVVGKALP